MSEQQQPTIAGHYDRVTGKPASIYTPPEDLVPAVAVAGYVPPSGVARVELDETITDRAAIRATVDDREPERLAATGLVVVQLQAELADVRHTLRLRSDALERVGRENEALRARLARSRSRHCGCGWCCSNNADSVVPGDAHLSCPRYAALAVTTGEGEHVAREVYTAEGIPFVRCSCTSTKSPTSSRWLTEHVPNGGVAELQAVVKRQDEGAKA